MGIYFTPSIRERIRERVQETIDDVLRAFAKDPYARKTNHDAEPAATAAAKPDAVQPNGKALGTGKFLRWDGNKARSRTGNDWVVYLASWGGFKAGRNGYGPENDPFFRDEAAAREHCEQEELRLLEEAGVLPFHEAKRREYGHDGLDWRGDGDGEVWTARGSSGFLWMVMRSPSSGLFLAGRDPNRHSYESESEADAKAWCQAEEDAAETIEELKASDALFDNSDLDQLRGEILASLRDCERKAGLYPITRRGTGRTIARAIQSIADALLQPDEWVCVVDHYTPSQPCEWMPKGFAEFIRETASRVGVTLDVKTRGNVVLVRSPVSRIIMEKRSPK
jgi:hypothetical protein